MGRWVGAWLRGRPDRSLPHTPLAAGCGRKSGSGLPQSKVGSPEDQMEDDL
jgi:hypothetical protein